MSGGWNVVGASVRGTSHRKTQTPCQDASAYMVMDNGLLLAAVSDGAGSAARSHLGAQQVVNQVLQALFSEFNRSIPNSTEAWGEVLSRAFQAARSRTLALAAEENGAARQYAATLTFLAADERWLATGQIGDGLAVAQCADGALHIVAAPQRGEYADSTYFITDETAPEMFFGRVYRQGQDLPPITALTCMTDGLTNLAIDKTTGRPHAPFFAPLLKVPAAMANHETARDALYAFLTSDRLNARTDDDRSLILAGRLG